MLFYLDNARSMPRRRTVRSLRNERLAAVVSDSAACRRDADSSATKQTARRSQRNYAREIMELHTLGVDGGYTQKDVTELARVLTGWTITRERDGMGEGAEFIFRRCSTMSGRRPCWGFVSRQVAELAKARRMIQILAHQPATAHRIAYNSVSDSSPMSRRRRSSIAWRKSSSPPTAIFARP